MKTRNQHGRRDVGDPERLWRVLGGQDLGRGDEARRRRRYRPARLQKPSRPGRAAATASCGLIPWPARMSRRDTINLYLGSWATTRFEWVSALPTPLTPPAKAGAQVFQFMSPNRSRQAGLARSITLSFHSLFHSFIRQLANKGRLPRFVFLEPDKARDVVLADEPAKTVSLVLSDPAPEVVGRANVERAIALAGQDVDVESHRKKRLGPGLRRGERRNCSLYVLRLPRQDHGWPRGE